MINVIKASAGSGKTYQLTYEYIKLLLGVKRKGRYELAHENDHERHRHILAVTFTNKATGEMKERIIRELSILAGKVEGKSSPYMKNLCSDFGNVQPIEVEKAAYKALVDLLFDYTNFNVSTIDSFFQMILRTFAKELKMSYNYDIELDDDYAINVGLNDFLSSLAHEKGVAADSMEARRVRRAKSWIREFVKDEVANKKSWNIFLDTESVSSGKNTFSRSFTFKDFAACLTKEELRLCIDDIVAYLEYDEDGENKVDRISRFKSAVNELTKDMKSAALVATGKIKSLCEVDGFDFINDINSRGGLQWLSKIDEANINCGLGSVKTEKILEAKGKCDTWFKKGKSKVKKELSEDTVCNVQKQLDLIAECNSRFLIFKDIRRNVFMLGLLGEISRYLSKFRKENDLILLADTNELLHRIINNDDTPFVYERVGMWLNHFLIDEFQDTSRAQWDNMKPLLYNSCAEGSDNLIIGDEKQCIYRFRNADPTLLRTDVEQHFTVQQNDSGKCINWRSTPNIVKFNNDFFTTIAEMNGAKEEYSNVAQDLPEGKKYVNEGYVEVQFIDADSSTEEGDEENSKFKDIVLQRLPNVINEIVSRGYKYSDIAVLVSTNFDGADVIKRILDYNITKAECERPINVISNESLMLKNSSAVRLVISHLRYLDTKLPLGESGKEKRTQDMEGYIHRVLRNYETLMFTDGKDAGVALAESFETVPRQEDNVELSLEALLPENTESFNIVSITERIIAQNITEEDLKSENAFVQALQDCVVDFSNRPNATIHEFLRWWDKGGCNTSVNTPDGQDAINVLTIHKSKGLEYKCVVIPFCDWDLLGKEEVLWLPKDVVVESGLLSCVDADLIPPLIPLQPNNDMDLEHNGLGEFCAKKRYSRIVDSLNKTYVGFTRAVDELYIYTPAKESKSETKMNSLLKSLPLNEEGMFIMGKKGKGMGFVADTETKELLKMPLYKVENARLEFTVPDLYGNEHRKRGTRLHDVFKRIRYNEDVDKALLYYKVRGVIPSDCYEEDRRIVKEAMEDERVQEWFSRKNKIYNERSLVRKMKKYRPDRFITTPDGRTIIIDYKFGDVHSASYNKQVKDYMNILQEIGFTNIEGYLWYPLEHKIEQIR